jgi:BirA family biotin operon repressor/biotin-[acetyl-CoA-carboxylase] ligase
MRFSNKIIFLDAVDSTNNYAANLIKAENVIHGTAILAENQFNGKGQRGNSWKTEAGKNLTCSIVLKPMNFKVNDQAMLSIVTSLGIIEALEQEGIDAQIKWPNDIYVRGKKIAGILIENFVKSERVEYAVLGVGLNVNQSENLLETSTSMKLITGTEFDKTQLLLGLLQKIEQKFMQLELGSNEYLMNLYYSNLMHYQRIQKYEVIEGVIEAKIVAVLNDGKLKVELISGEERIFDIKEIKFLKFE